MKQGVVPLRPAPAAPTIAILDDYQRQALNLADWSILPLGTAIVVFSEPARDDHEPVARLQRFDVVVTMRERTAFPAAVLERLPRLALLASTGTRNVAIDAAACQRRASRSAARVATAAARRPLRKRPGR